MKTPTIKFQHDVMTNELKHAPYDLTAADVKRMIKDAIALAERLAGKGCNRVAKPLKRNTKSGKKSAWKGDSLIVDYFGDGSLTVASMKDVRRRLDRAHRRLADKKLTIRVLPQCKASSSSTRAQNLGSVFSPKKFKLFSSWFGIGDATDRAAIIIHELNHDLFLDQKIENNGQRVTVYGNRLAKKLARQKPKKARRSAENYEQFCKRV